MISQTLQTEDIGAASGKTDDIKETRTKLLLVEDNHDNRQMMKATLELEYGYDVIEAEDGQQACHLAVQEKPDAILMDLDLPVMNGVEASERLRLQSTTQQIPIIVLSAHLSASEWALQARDAGCLAHVRKPVDFTTLHNTINKILDTAGSNYSV